MEATNTITITYGDQAEAHVGMKKNGSMAESGLSIDEINEAEKLFLEKGGDVVNYDLKNLLEGCEIKEVCDLLENTEDAKFLVVYNGIDILLNDGEEEQKEMMSHIDMYEEQNNLTHDRKYWDLRRKKVLNKNARGNLCFDYEGSEADFEGEHVGTIISFDDVPFTNKVRIKLPDYFGGKVKDMKAEGNYYYNKKKCGIGYHGDAERKITIGARLGATMPLCYQWFYKGKAVGNNLRIEIPSGAIYAMSQKAAGCDWKRRNILTLRHSAGCEKYTKIVDSKKW